MVIIRIKPDADDLALGDDRRRQARFCLCPAQSWGLHFYWRIVFDLSSSLTLDQTHIGQRCIVQDVTSPAAAPEWARWLDEIGFTPGEQVTLMARGAFGGDPLVVRVGTSTFALRRAEAACVRVEAAAA
ncbi:MAG: FeoA family protein [Burkholderiaceae bacterium]